MKFSIVSILALAFIATAAPSEADFSLVGFAKDNPIGPTTGGAGKNSPTVTVSSVPELIAAVAGTEPKIIIAKGKFNLTARLRPGSNKSIIGAGKGAKITGAGITIANATNVIFRNFHIEKIVGNDAITIQNSTRVWVDHNEFSSELSVEVGSDYYDGQLDIIRASDWITVSWNYFHDHWKSSLIGNNDQFRDIDFGHLHVTYHHNYWRKAGTRGPAGRFGHQHIYNNLYHDFLYQAIHSRSDNQVLVEGNVFNGKTRTALTTYGLVIPEDSPNTGPDGDYELDGYANLGAKNDFGKAIVNITRVGDFKKAPYKYKLTPLKDVVQVVKKNAGIGKI